MTRRREPLLQRFWQAALIVVLLPIILPLALIVLVLYLLQRIGLYILVWVLWLPRAIDVLMVYSDSPIWHDYMTTQVLPLVQERAVVLNWSERKKWPRVSLGVALLRHFGGSREFNPLVLLFRPMRAVQTFRFWYAFKEWKRGYTEPVDKLRQELMSAL